MQTETSAWLAGWRRLLDRWRELALVCPDVWLVRDGGWCETDDVTDPQRCRRNASLGPSGSKFPGPSSLESGLIDHAGRHPFVFEPSLSARFPSAGVLRLHSRMVPHAVNLSWGLVHDAVASAAGGELPDYATAVREAERQEAMVLAAAEQSADWLDRCPLPRNEGFLRPCGAGPTGWFERLFEAGLPTGDCPRQVDRRYRGPFRFAGQRPVDWFRDGAWRSLIESDDGCSCGWASKLRVRVQRSAPRALRRLGKIACESIHPAVCQASLLAAEAVEAVFDAMLDETSPTSPEVASTGSPDNSQAFDDARPLVRNLQAAYRDLREQTKEDWFTLQELADAAGYSHDTVRQKSRSLQSEGIFVRSPRGLRFRVVGSGPAATA